MRFPRVSCTGGDCCRWGHAGGQQGGRGTQRRAEAGSRHKEAAPPRARCSAASASASHVAGQPVSLATGDAKPGVGEYQRPETRAPMAQKPLSTAAAERMNLVAQDEIW